MRRCNRDDIRCSAVMQAQERRVRVSVRSSVELSLSVQRLTTATDGEWSAPVRRSRLYEDLLLKQLRKTSRVLCLETAYSCDRRSLIEWVSSDLTDNVSKCKSSDSRTGRKNVQPLPGVAGRSTWPGQRALPSSHESIRGPQASQEKNAGPAEENECRDDAVVRSPSLPSRSPAEVSSERACLTASAEVLISRPPNDGGDFHRDRFRDSTRDGCSKNGNGDATLSAASFDPVVSDVTSPLGKLRLLDDDRIVRLSACTAPGEPTSDAGHRSEVIDDKDALNLTLDALEVDNKLNALIVKAELLKTEALKRCPKNRDRSKERAVTKEGAACAATPIKTEETHQSSSAEQIEELSPAADIGIECYRPDNPNVLQRKIEDLEGQIQDLQEANMATYEEVVRLQKENQSLREHSSYRESSDATTTSIDSSSRYPVRLDHDVYQKQDFEFTTSDFSEPSWKDKPLTRTMEKDDALERAQVTTLTESQTRGTSASSDDGGSASGSTRQHGGHWRSHRLNTVYSSTAPAPRWATEDDGDSVPSLHRPPLNGGPSEETEDFCLTGRSSACRDFYSTALPSPRRNVPGECLTSPRKAQPFVPRAPADLSLGDSVKYTRPNGKIGRGVITYVGWCGDKRDICVGVMADEQGTQFGRDEAGERNILRGCVSRTRGWASSSRVAPRLARGGSQESVLVPFPKVLMVWKKRSS